MRWKWNFPPKGSVIYDPSFDLFKEIGHLCQLCKAISANTKLVKPGGAQCLPAGKYSLKGSQRGLADTHTHSHMYTHMRPPTHIKIAQSIIYETS